MTSKEYRLISERLREWALKNLPETGYILVYSSGAYINPYDKLGMVLILGESLDELLRVNRLNRPLVKPSRRESIVVPIRNYDKSKVPEE